MPHHIAGGNKVIFHFGTGDFVAAGNLAPSETYESLLLCTPGAGTSRAFAIHRHIGRGQVNAWNIREERP